MKSNRLNSLFIGVIIAMMMGCSASKYSMPADPINDPIILPDKMARHSLRFNSYSFEKDPISPLVNMALSAMIPSYGLSKQVEMPFVLLPYFKIQINENQFYKTSEDLSHSFDHAFDIGLVGFHYNQAEGFVTSLAIGYELTQKLSNSTRYDFSLNYVQVPQDFSKNYLIIVNNQLSQSLSDPALMYIGHTFQYEYSLINYYKSNLYFGIYHRFSSYFSLNLQTGVDVYNNYDFDKLPSRLQHHYYQFSLISYW